MKKLTMKLLFFIETLNQFYRQKTTCIMSHKYLEDCIEVSVREPSQVGQDKKSLLLDFFLNAGPTPRAAL